MLDFTTEPYSINPEEMCSDAMQFTSDEQKKEMDLTTDQDLEVSPDEMRASSDDLTTVQE